MFTVDISSVINIYNLIGRRILVKEIGNVYLSATVVEFHFPNIWFIFEKNNSMILLGRSIMEEDHRLMICPMQIPGSKFRLNEGDIAEVPWGKQKTKALILRRQTFGEHSRGRANLYYFEDRHVTDSPCKATSAWKTCKQRTIFEIDQQYETVSELYLDFYFSYGDLPAYKCTKEQKSVLCKTFEREMPSFIGLDPLQNEIDFTSMEVTVRVIENDETNCDKIQQEVTEPDDEGADNDENRVHQHQREGISVPVCPLHEKRRSKTGTLNKTRKANERKRKKRGEKNKQIT